MRETAPARKRGQEAGTRTLLPVVAAMGQIKRGDSSVRSLKNRRKRWKTYTESGRWSPGRRVVSAKSSPGSTPHKVGRLFLWRAGSSSAYRWTIFRARPSPTPSIHNTELITMDDVIIIGGSFAGLAGALQLGRAGRKVTVLDTGLPRNRFAGHSHGLLGHDHKPPLEILAEARQQLARYPTIRLVNARADSIFGAIDNFSVLTGDGESLGARRLILSYGVADQMPDVPGFAEGWGRSIVPCPYCDGFEVAGQHWGLAWSSPQSHQSARLFLDWTDKLTVFANGHDIPADVQADLARRKIPVIDGRIIATAHHGCHTDTVNLHTGR